MSDRHLGIGFAEKTPGLEQEFGWTKEETSKSLTWVIVAEVLSAPPKALVVGTILHASLHSHGVLYFVTVATKKKN